VKLYGILDFHCACRSGIEHRIGGRHRLSCPNDTWNCGKVVSIVRVDSAGDHYVQRRSCGRDEVFQLHSGVDSR
jgi:hypothetical protein